MVNRVNSREFVGKAARITGLHEKTVFESNIMKFAVHSGLVESEYVNIFLNSPFVRRQVLARCKDAINQSSINQEDVCSLKIPKVDLDVQRQLLRQLENIKNTNSKIGIRMEQARIFSMGLLQRFESEDEGS